MFQSSQLEEKLRSHFREKIKIESGIRSRDEY